MKGDFLELCWNGASDMSVSLMRLGEGISLVQYASESNEGSQVSTFHRESESEQP